MADWGQVNAEGKGVRDGPQARELLGWMGVVAEESHIGGGCHRVVNPLDHDPG